MFVETEIHYNLEALKKDTFIQQGCIQLMKRDRKDIINVRKDLYFK